MVAWLMRRSRMNERASGIRLLDLTGQGGMIGHPHPQQRPQEGAAPNRHAGQRPDAGAAQQPQQHRLGLVVEGVSQQHGMPVT